MLSLKTPRQISSDATVLAHVQAPYIPGEYIAHNKTPETLHYLPSLPWFCITKLARFPDQVQAIGASRITYTPPELEGGYDILRALIPSLSSPDFSWSTVDPRLWATIIQIYDNLPPIFRCYPIPLDDEYLPVLQEIEPTPQFCLITILELPGCPDLSDANIVKLKHLHSLCALDASWTSISSHALKILAGTLSWSEDGGARRGPWGLRILRLRDCPQINDKVHPHVSKFPLLSVLDLRGTKCKADTFQPFGPAPTKEHHLYNPTSLRQCVALLPSEDAIFSSRHPFTLYVNTLYHPRTKSPPRTRPLEDVCVTFGGPNSTGFVVGSSRDETIPRKWERREKKPRMVTTLYDEIAAEELSSQSKERDVLSFYNRKGGLAPHTSSLGYAYPREASQPPSAKEARLMLFRPLPPWAALEAATSDAQPLKPLGASSKVIVEVSKSKKEEMVHYANQLAGKRRKLQEQSIQEVPVATAPETAELSRNPFRRKQKSLNVEPPQAAKEMDGSKASFNWDRWRKT
ncbi:hypothetical protein FB45DRAFT_831842 [Roridomyces roridus]|uniref:Uncharacterized protein n=1 Tax=Roridomyces roridus TaxID=1738132 RepID=A0AAD7BWL4_9AGAR|nr:hypothetical protein FB45DRAFT_831842 [Roridomyces roridus]